MMRKYQRLAIAVKPDLEAVLTKLSDLTCTPRSTIIVDYLTEAIPVFNTLIEAIENAKKGHHELAADSMAKFLQKASANAVQASIEFEGMKKTYGNKRT